MSKNAIRVTGIVCLLLMLLTMLCGCGRKSDDDSSRSESGDPMKAENNAAEKLSDEQALAAIRNYCYSRNPALEGIVKAGEYPVYWDISSSDEKGIVILFRSYTGAQNRYYIDRLSGETYVTEFVPGITDEEQRTDENFNIRDYIGP